MNASHRHWTLDLLLVVVGAVAALAVILLDVPGSVVRSLLVVPLIVLYPGYALLAAIFPERRSDVESDRMGREQTVTSPTPHTAGLFYSVRIILAATASLAITGAIGLVTNFLGMGFAAEVVGLGAFGVTMVLTGIAVVRRALLPGEAREGFPPLAVIFGSAATAAGTLNSPLSRDSQGASVSVLVNLLLVVSVVAFLSSVGFAMVETHSPESDFTEVYLVTENGSGYEASGYPQQLTQGEPTPVTLAVENHEHETASYTVVTELQRLDRTANGSTVVEERELWRTEQTVEDNETAYIQRDVTPTMSGDSLRLVFHVYKGAVPDDPDRSNAYRTVQLVVSVGGDGTQSVQISSGGPGT
ncbi:DUF1616 domain-containing protein [Haloferax sp. DFSO52]|uniref:DUF1616 domain-containing protein n=1 Tax=Haloferax sp. DFSO52 TaxID=3388505 RepID=UPI003A8B8927